MTVNELIDELTNLRDNGYGETDVKVAYQPNYPMEVEIDCLTGYNGHKKDMNGDESDEKTDDPCVYLATSDCNGYSMKYAWDGNIDTLDDEDYVEYEDDED